MIKAIGTATEHQLIVNYPDVRKLDLNREATRAEVVAMVYQALVRQGRVPQVVSNYIPIIKPDNYELANLEDLCKDTDIEDYISELRKFQGVSSYKIQNREKYKKERKRANNEFKPIAYHLIVNCGKSSVPRLINEINEYSLTKHEFSSYYSIIFSALIKTGKEVVPSLISIFKKDDEINLKLRTGVVPYEVEDINKQALALYIISAIGSDAERAIPSLINLIQEERFLQSDNIYSITVFDALNAIGLSNLSKYNKKLEDVLNEVLEKAIQTNNYDLVQKIALLSHRFKFSTNRATDYLTYVLRNPRIEQRFRSSSAKTLALIGASPEKIVPFLIEQTQSINIQELASGDNWYCIYRSECLEVASIEALGLYGKDASSAIDKLNDLLVNVPMESESIRKSFEKKVKLYKEWHIQSLVIYALGEIGFSNHKTILRLKKIIESPKLYSKLFGGPGESGTWTNLPISAALALSKQSRKIVEIEEVAKDLLESKDIKVKILASHILVNFSSKGLVNLADNLRKLDSGPFSHLLDNVGYGIGDGTPPVLIFYQDSVSTLLNHLNGNNEPLRSFSAYGLSNMQDRSPLDTKLAISSLIEALHTGDSDTRVAAINALSIIGKDAQNTSSVLLIAMGDKDIYVQRAAAHALFSVNSNTSFQDETKNLLKTSGVGGGWQIFFSAIKRFIKGQ